MKLKRIGLIFIMSILAVFSQAQVNAVEFGKNRVQYKKLVWKFHQSPNFNTYTSQGGVELGKFVAQVAEQELGAIENFVEYSLQRRANIIVYSNYDAYKSSHPGDTVRPHGGQESSIVAHVHQVTGPGRILPQSLPWWFSIQHLLVVFRTLDQFVH